MTFWGTICLFALVLSIGICSSSICAATESAPLDKNSHEPVAGDSSLPRIVNACTCIPKTLPNVEIEPEAGEAVLEIEIDEHNHFITAGIIKSSGYKLLDRTAVHTVSQCDYRSGVVDGKPIRSALHLIYGWKFHNGSDSYLAAYFR